ncbi:hypothetical protein QZH41_000099 [Actinostola sp. cb2023]|nr:hypothetical protein QZH41_000099 [Actinostola sp. cb2023]
MENIVKGIRIAKMNVWESPLSALVSSIRSLIDKTSEIMGKLIRDLLSNTCRVVVSNDQNVLEQCSHVVVMDNGRVKQQAKSRQNYYYYYYYYYYYRNPHFLNSGVPAAWARVKNKREGVIRTI